MKSYSQLPVMKNILAILFFCCTQVCTAQSFNGLDMNLSNLSRLSKAKTRSITPENFSGASGRGGMANPAQKIRNVSNGADEAKEMGLGWKVNPYVWVAAGEELTLAEIEGPGAVQHIWMTPAGNWNTSIFRIYWDNEVRPSVECPVGPFFGMGWREYAPLNSLAMTVNPGSAFNSYWKMPFRKKCRITMQNLAADSIKLYYQVDYVLTTIDSDEAYFHAQYRRSNPTKGSLHTIVDSIRGQGHYVGTYMGIGVNNNGWWGEGEVKFFMDADRDYATIVGTGTEDYFCGSYNFENRASRQYETFSTAYAGLHQVIRPDGMYKSQQRFGMYRWHITDPIRFEKALKVTVQDLGWRADWTYLPQQSDIITVAYWYQTEPHTPFPPLPHKNELDIP